MVWILGAGFVASALSAAFFSIVRSFGITRFSPGVQLGCLLVDDPRLPAAESAGLALHLLIGSTVVAAAYAGLLPMMGGPGWLSGAALGVLHGGAVIAAGPWLARLNRAVRAGRVPPPGRFGTGWGRWTPLVVLVGAMLHGGVMGAVLGAAQREPGANLAVASHVRSHHVTILVQGPLQGGLRG